MPFLPPDQIAAGAGTLAPLMQLIALVAADPKTYAARLEELKKLADDTRKARDDAQEALTQMRTERAEVLKQSSKLERDQAAFAAATAKAVSDQEAKDKDLQKLEAEVELLRQQSQDEIKKVRAEFATKERDISAREADVGRREVKAAAAAARLDADRGRIDRRTAALKEAIDFN